MEYADRSTELLWYPFALSGGALDYAKMLLSSFSHSVFFTSSCNRKVCFGRDCKFSDFPYCNCLLPRNMENAARLNEPLVHTFIQ